MLLRDDVTRTLKRTETQEIDETITPEMVGLDFSSLGANPAYSEIKRYAEQWVKRMLVMRDFARSKSKSPHNGGDR
jgi:hypothetical protein